MLILKAVYVELNHLNALDFQACVRRYGGSQAPVAMNPLCVLCFVGVCTCVYPVANTHFRVSQTAFPNGKCALIVFLFGTL